MIEPTELQKEIINIALLELRLAKINHNEQFWSQDNEYAKCLKVAVMANEAGEALKAAVKFYLEGKGKEIDIFNELIQVISTSIRVLECMTKKTE